MSVASRFERSILSHDEWTLVARTHHPAILSHERADLLDTLARLRDMRDKERTFAFHRRRESRGKAAPRGDAFPGTAERPSERKQVFAAAVKRLNKEVARIDAVAAREDLSRSAHRALALRRAALADRVRPLDATSTGGMGVSENRKVRPKVQGSRVGRTSAATKRSQARRDSRS